MSRLVRALSLFSSKRSQVEARRRVSAGLRERWAYAQRERGEREKEGVGGVQKEEKKESERK